MLTVDHMPTCTEPLLVVALAGWVDAGFAGAGAAAALVEYFDAPDRFGAIDLADLCDLQQTRPTARFTEGGLRVIDWPRVTFVAGKVASSARGGSRDVVCVSGPEPSLSWPAVATAIVETAARLGVTEAATLGGMPSLVTHRRALPVLATATRRSLAQEVGPLRADYAGPTGLQTVVQHALGEAGIPCVGLWAQVPQYVSGSPSPPAVLAILRRLAELYRLDLDLASLDERSRQYVERVEEGLAARPDIREIVDRIDREGPALPSGDQLVSEIEQFLRAQPDEG